MECYERLELLVEQMKAGAGVTEKRKATDQMKWTTSESVVANEDGDSTTDFKASLLNKNNSYNETLKKNISSILVIAAIPQGISLLLYLTIVFLFFLLTFFILLPDGWTLINQKVRLDN